MSSKLRKFSAGVLVGVYAMHVIQALWPSGSAAPIWFSTAMVILGIILALEDDNE